MWEHVPVPDMPPEGYWSKEERLLFKEAIAIFKKDPCSIAMVIGRTKSCMQVASYLQLPEISAVANKLIGEATKKRWPLELNRGGHLIPKPESSSDDEDDGSDDGLPEVTDKSKSRGNKRHASRRDSSNYGVSKNKQTYSQDSTEDADNSQEADFIPCAHVGPCDKAVCRCYAKNLKCEATCGCNCGRWTIRGYETPGNKPGTSDKRKICRRRHWGCSCPPESHCNTSACECWEERRSCDPDFCDHCQANLLPSQISSTERGCRNVGVPIGRHKRTIIGKSAVHGFGLFAGEVFEEGDLVGIYGGQILDTKKADTLGFLYDAKDHTFFFDVTQSLVVDGGVLGMKSKFVNHVSGGSIEENCMSRCVRVRGMAHIALFATRQVLPGEEFRFDYKFQVVVPDWARRKESPGSRELGDRKPETPGRYSSGKTTKKLADAASSKAKGKSGLGSRHGSDSDIAWMDES
jgi:histone-lysine N-methyltransferase EZH2